MASHRSYCGYSQLSTSGSDPSARTRECDVRRTACRLLVTWSSHICYAEVGETWFFEARFPDFAISAVSILSITTVLTPNVQLHTNVIITAAITRRGIAMSW